MQLDWEHQVLFAVEGRRYACWPNSFCSERKAASSNLSSITAPTLATVIPVDTSSSCVTTDLLLDFESTRLSHDDVHAPAFWSVVLFQTRSADCLAVDNGAIKVMKQWGVSKHEVVEYHNVRTVGPHLIADGQVIPVYRLYDDTARAFVASFRHTSWTSPRLYPLSVGNAAHQTRTLGVSSRCIVPVSQLRPLQGLRMTVKDMFDIKDHRTGLGSHAYLKCATPATFTAPAIQKLLYLGASLVGSTKLCALIGKTEPTQTIDHEAPWNPRADGFQSPSGGSSGQPSAIATYEWLDFAIGSDSTISGRAPAQANGCFSLRPSTGAVSTDGMWSGVSRFDTPCLFARDIEVIERVAKAWYEPRKSLKDSLPRAILHPVDFLPLDNEQQMSVVECFLEHASKALSSPVRRFSISDAWDTDPPLEAESMKLKDFLDAVVATRSYVYSFWQRIAPLHGEYRRRFGHEPFFPLPEGIHLWDDAKGVSAEESEAAWRRIDIYKQWILNNVMKQGELNNVIIMPLGNVKPTYRDEWPCPKKGDQQMWEPLMLAPILGAPEVVVPAGQLKYRSRISGEDEVLPICMSIMGLPGSDLDLVELAHGVLRHSGRPTQVLTGKTMF